MNDKFPDIGSRFVPKDAAPKGAEVREVTGYEKKSDGHKVDRVVTAPIKNIVVPTTVTMPLDHFNKNYKLI